MHRKRKQQILKDLNKKLVILTGPRQVGKTWLALDIAKDFNNYLYLNWDNSEHKKIITDKAWLPNIELLILDEIHKMPYWKNYLKGLYDTKPKELKILVTCSASLDYFKQLGDSLAGRFFRHKLNPLSLAELEQASEKTQDKLIEDGGFPEPFLATRTDANRWRQLYINSLITTDILSLENIHKLKNLNTLVEILRNRVGSPISFKNIAGDLQISHSTVKHYVELLEALFIIFRVTPFSRNIARSLLKEPKIYFYDTGMVKNEGAKFENFVAVSLLKHQETISDINGISTGLHYLRTKDKREVDFCLTEEGTAKRLIEVKTSQKDIDKNLLYFYKKYQIPSTQIVRYLDTEQMVNGILLQKSYNFLKNLYE